MSDIHAALAIAEALAKSMTNSGGETGPVGVQGDEDDPCARFAVDTPVGSFTVEVRPT